MPERDAVQCAFWLAALDKNAANLQSSAWLENAGQSAQCL
jgi:hypothetical protein